MKDKDEFLKELGNRLLQECFPDIEREIIEIFYAAEELYGQTLVICSCRGSQKISRTLIEPTLLKNLLLDEEMVEVCLRYNFTGEEFIKVTI